MSQKREGCSLLSQNQSERLLAVNHQQSFAILAVFLYTDKKKNILMWNYATKLSSQTI